MELIASGREADVYALGRDRVLRRYRNGDDAVPEAELMAHLLAAGYPVPIVYDADGTDLVMERLDGPTMLAAAIDGRADAGTIAAVLADLHERLHAVPARAAARPGDRILHLDLHPDNVLLTGRGPVVIDWRNSREATPDRDVAMTLLIVAQASLWTHLPLVAEVAAVALAPLAAALPVPSAAALAWVVERRRANPTMTPTELAQLDDAAALVTVDVVPGAQAGNGR